MWFVTARALSLLVGLLVLYWVGRFALGLLGATINVLILVVIALVILRLIFRARAH